MSNQEIIYRLHKIETSLDFLCERMNLDNETRNNRSRRRETQTQTQTRPTLSSLFSDITQRYNNSTNPTITPQSVELTFTNPLFDNIFNTTNTNEDNTNHILMSHRTINDSTEILTHQSAENEEITCAICQENIENNNVIRKIKKCNHFFHINCLDKWLENHATCPSCRTDIRENR